MYVYKLLNNCTHSNPASVAFIAWRLGPTQIQGAIIFPKLKRLNVVSKVRIDRLVAPCLENESDHFRNKAAIEFGRRYTSIILTYFFPLGLFMTWRHVVTSSHSFAPFVYGQIIFVGRRFPLDSHWGNIDYEWKPNWLLIDSSTDGWVSNRAIRAPSQYKDRLIYVWRFPC